MFKLSAKAFEMMFPIKVPCPSHLAYIEWFTPFERAPGNNHLMHLVKCSLSPIGGGVPQQKCLASIIPVDSIHRSVHLIPKFGPVAPRSWTSANILEECTTFFVNSLTDRHTYITVY